MTTDPITAARKLAEQAVQQRVNLVQSLVHARNQESAANDALTAAKKALDLADGPLKELGEALKDAADRLLKGAKDEVGNARRAAEQGGWTQDDLRAMGVLPPKRPRKPRAASPKDLPESGTPQRAAASDDVPA
ncbi:hypothetical protein [Lentzea albidocapillata]|nr:hypothetical protein [Lentzea albidocapillata]